MTTGGLEIRVVTHGGLPRPKGSGSPDDSIVLDEGATLAEVLASLGIDRGLVGVVSLEGRIIQLDAALQSGGVFHVYPIFGGG
jgi:sulfur carrier protein ThiS